MRNKVSKEFESLLTLCDEEKDFFRLTVRESFEKGFLPWFESYRNGDKSFDDNLKGMTENGLSEEEAFFILAYTGGSSSWINLELRNSNLPKSKCKGEFVKRLNDSLSKVKSFDNDMVFRMDNPPGENEETLTWFQGKIGSKFRIPYFLSTAKEDYENSELVWQIKTLNQNSLGKDISRLTNNKYELEVLFQTGSCFEIIGIEKERRYVHLNEIFSHSKVDFELTGFYVGNVK
jgi:hypothetical protein